MLSSLNFGHSSFQCILSKVMYAMSRGITNDDMNMNVGDVVNRGIFIPNF